jgi:hypothetical protein
MNFLQQNKDDLIARAEWMAEQTNDLQMLKAYMHARVKDIKLSAGQKEKLKRWQFVYDQISSGKYTDKEVRLQLMDKFGIEDRTSYSDLRDTTELMSTTMNINKRFKIQIDIQLLDVMKQKARETNQLDAYARLQKVQSELYKMLPDEDEVPADYFTPRQNIMQFNPELLGIAAIPDKQMKDLFTQLKTEFNIVDIEYEVIPNDKAADTLQ